MIIRVPLTVLSPAGSRARLSVLIFHRVLPQRDALFPDVLDAAQFEQRMRWVQQWFNVLPLHGAIEQLYAGTLPSRALAITFDDGYADNETLAAPILKKLGLTATFFVTTGFLGAGCMWNDQIIEAIRDCASSHLDLAKAGLGEHSLMSMVARQQAVAAILKTAKHLEPAQRQAATQAVVAACGASSTPPRLMMSPDQVRSLRQLGMQVGAHTLTHPILSRLDAKAALVEIRDSKTELEQLLGEPVPLFAYPNGVPNQDYGAAHTQMVQDCGFQAAVSTAWGAACVRSHRFELPRFTPWDTQRLRFGIRMATNLLRVEAVAATPS
jgi:peptidoglycan/xylan/chitin deacetylase (PgdA/CDA1 family)